MTTDTVQRWSPANPPAPRRLTLLAHATLLLLIGSTALAASPPVLDNTGNMSLTAVNEDEATPAGDTVAAIIASAGGDRITDADGDPEGIAVYDTAESDGLWEYSIDGGTNWSAFGSVAQNAARLLAETAKVRFIPDADFNGSVNPGISFRAWDQSAGTNGGTDNISGGGGAYSTATETASIAVNPVNDAPVLDNSGDLSLTTINEDAANPAGDLIQDMIASDGGNRITDVDSGALEGIAIYAANTANGTWEFQLNGSPTWTSLGAVATDNARILPANAKVRFLPSADFNGTLATAISFYAWDLTAGTPGSTADATTRGGTTAFSSASDSAALTVSPVNDAPALDSSGDLVLTDVTEDDSDPAGDTVADILASDAGTPISDIDSGALQGIAVTAVSTTNGTWQFSTNGGSNWSNMGSVASNSARLLRDTDLVRFRPSTNFAGTVNSAITFRAWDRTSGTAGNTADTTTNGGTTAFSTGTETASVTVTNVNDAPVLDNTGAMTLSSVNEDEAAPAGSLVSGIIASATGDRITDPDAGALEGIAITAAAETNGSWQYSIDGGANWLSLSGVSASAAQLLSPTALVRFVPAADFNGSVDPGITFRAWDQTSGTVGGTADVTTNGGTTAFSSATETASIQVIPVNDAPVLDNSSDLVFTAVNEDTAAPAGNTVSSLLASGAITPISDIDAGAQQGIAVTAVDNANGAWEFSTNGGSTWTPFGTASEAAARLLTPASRIRFVPAANYNGLIDPAITLRAWDQTTGSNGGTADASVNGGTTPFSVATETASITVNPVNDAPALDDSGDLALTDVDEEDNNPSGDSIAALLASGGGTPVTDVDLDTPGIAVTGIDSAHGLWQFSLTAGATWSAITSVDTSNALLLSDSDLVRFLPASNFIGQVPTGITFQAWDQTSGTRGTFADVTAGGGTSPFSADSETASVEVVNVNDAPVLDNAGVMQLNSVTEDETDPSGGTVAAFLAGAGGDRITDIDPGALEGIAVIAADNANGSWQYSIDDGATWGPIASVDETTAVLLRDSDKVRFVPAANFNGLVDPGIEFRAWDQSDSLPAGSTADTSTNGGTSAFSTDTDTLAISIVPVNDAPQLADDAETLPEDVPGGFVIDVLANDTDVEGLDPATVNVITPPQHGSTGVNLTTGAITFSPDTNYSGPDSFVYRVRDIGDNGQAQLLATATVSLTITPVNDTPLAVNDTTSVTAGSSVVIDVLANDVDVESPLDPNITIVTPPTGGSITNIDSGSGAVTYLANDSFQGIDQFVYEVADTGDPLPALTAQATVLVAVSQLQIEVDTLDDNDDGDFTDNNFSLREAIKLIGDGGQITVDPAILSPGVSTINLDPVLGQMTASRSFTLTGPGPDRLQVDGGGATRLLDISAGNANIAGLAFFNGAVNDAAGAGLRVASGASLLLSDCLVSGCVAADTNAAVDELGGGIYAEGALTLDRVTIEACISGGFGGGIYSMADLSLSNVTLSGNTAVMDDGGGLHMEDGSGLIMHCTITGNTAENGGGISKTAGTLSINNSIIAGNTATAANNDVAGIIESNGFNLVEDTSGSEVWLETDLVGVDAGVVLEPDLADNDGPMPTHALVADSPAIDAADAVTTAGSGLTTDQRGAGFDRIAGNAPDIGAYEVRHFQITTFDDENDASPVPGADLSLREAVGISLAGDNLYLDAGTVSISPALGPIVIPRGLGIQGQPASSILDGGGAAALLYIPSATAQVVLRDLTFEDAFDDTGLQNRGGSAVFSFGITRLRHCTFTGNTAQDLDGGALHNRGKMTISDGTFQNNTAGNLGGALVNWGGELVMERCVFSENESLQQGGALLNLLSGVVHIEDTLFQDNNAAIGGALHNANSATMHVLRSTFAGNESTSDGGAILNLGVLHLANVTISGNSAGRSGGGLHSNATMFLTNVTVTNNTADNVNSGFAEGGGLFVGAGTATLINTVVAANFDTPYNAGQGNIHADISGPVVSGGHNLVGNSNGATGIANGTNGDQVGISVAPIDPRLGLLLDNGGLTPTHLPKVESPLIDAGDDAAVTTAVFGDEPIADQRGGAFARIVDGDGDTAASVDIGATEYVPTQPVFSSTPVLSVNEDEPYSYPIEMADSDVEEQFTITAPTLPYWLTFTDNGDGTALLAGTPTNEELAPVFDTKPYDVVLAVVDWAGQTQTQSFTITVNGVNDAPEPVDDAAQTNEDTAVVVDVLANDVDDDGALDPASVTVAAPPANGTASVNPANGRITYTPALHFNGTDTFTYEVTDLGIPGPFLSTTALVTVTVNAVNDPPFAEADAATTDEDVPVVVDVLLNDSDVDGALIPGQVAVTVAPAHGNTAVDPDSGAITYTPEQDYNGTDTFTYRVPDNGSPLPVASSEAIVTITLNPVNDAPAVVDDTVSTNEDTAKAISVLANDADVDGTPLPASVVVTSEPSHGAVSVNPGTGVITYTPEQHYNGPDSFTYEVTDDGSPTPALTSPGTVNITVTAVNDAPFTEPDDASTDEDNAVLVDVLANDSDVDGSLVPGSVSVTVAPAHGSTAVDPDTGVITYTPSENYYGSDTFTYEVSDDGSPTPALKSPAVVSVTVNPVNDAPVAVDDLVVTNEDSPVTIEVLANDSDIDGQLVPGRLTIISPPAHGSLAINSTLGTLTYSPAADYFGNDSFVYTIDDDGVPPPVLFDSATVNIQVLSVNDAPVAIADSATTDEDMPVTVAVLANDSDVDTDNTIVPATVQVSVPPAHGAAVVNPGTGAVTYTSAEHYNGTDSLTYTASDNGTPPLTMTAVVSLTITPVNDAPFTNPDSANTNEDEPVTVAVLANDSDVDGNLVPASVAVVTPPLHGSTTVNPENGAITFTPSPDYNGADTFVYAVTDDGAPAPVRTSQGTVQIAIQAVNDAPDLGQDTAVTQEDTVLGLNVLANDSDRDGAIRPETLTIISPPQHGAVTIKSDFSLRYDPADDYYGPDSFTYRVEDDGSPEPAQNSSSQVSLDVLPVNDPPAPLTDTASTDEDTPVVVDVLANDDDVDGELVPGSVTVTVPPQHGTTAVNPQTGAITYTPAEDYNGTDTFTYRVADDGFPEPALDATATVLLAVGAVNDTVDAVDDAATTKEDTSVTVDVLSNDSDIDGELLPATVSITRQPAHGTTSVDAATGAVTYIPASDYNGTDSFTYLVTDDGTPLPESFDTAEVNLTVTAVNDAPSVTAPEDAEGLQDTALLITGISVADVDYAETQDGVIEVALAVENGTLSLADTEGVQFTQGGNATSAFTMRGAAQALNAALAGLSYLGAPLYYGPDTLSLHVSDQGNTGEAGPLTADKAVALTIVPVSMVVTTLEDVVDDSFLAGYVSLREALAEIHDGGVITFAEGLAGAITLDPDLGQLAVTRSMTITGPGPDLITVSAGLASRVLRVDDGDNEARLDVVLSGLTLQDGVAPLDAGGAIYNRENLVVTECALLGSSASDGGGIYNAGDLTLSNSTGSGNLAGDRGGFLLHLASGILRVSNCTITDNSARQGGGLLNLGAATVVNTTFSANRASDSGGAIFHGGLAACAAVNCTLTGNTADNDGNASGNGGGIAVLNGAVALTLRNCIVAGNADLSASSASAVHPDVSGLFDANGVNLLGSAAGSNSFGTDTILLSAEGVTLDQVLDPNLDDNGGPTLTHALRMFSVAVNKGDNSLVAPPLFAGPPFSDQRGAEFPRIARGLVDLGAYELQPNGESLVVSVSLAEGQAALTAFLPLEFLVTFSEQVNGFDAADVQNTGTAEGTVFEVEPLVGSQYMLRVTSTGPGTVVPAILPGDIDDSWNTGVDLEQDGQPEVMYDPVLDSDNDTILDTDEGRDDADNDGSPNFEDDDSDNDGVPDNIELAVGGNPYDASAPDITLVVSPAAVDLPSGVGSVQLTVQHFGLTSVAWTVSRNPADDWIRIQNGASGVNNGAIRINYVDNPQPVARTAVVTVNAPGATVGVPVAVTLTQAGCALPEAPANAIVTRPDDDTLRMTWDMSPDAVLYRIYSSRNNNALLAEVVETAAEISLIEDGLFGGCSQFRPDPAEFNYWVTAVNACGESEPANATLDLKTALYEKALPATASEDGDRLAAADGTISVRLRASAPIDPDSVWGMVSGDGFASEDIVWLPIDAEGRDGWVVFTPETPWQDGERITLLAGAFTVSGESIEPVSFDFVVAADQAVLMQRAAAGAIPAGLQDAAGDSPSTLAVPVQIGEANSGETPALIYLVEPQAPFEGPAWVWMPIGEQVDPGAVRVQYLLSEEALWADAVQVEGLLDSEDSVAVLIGGTTYVGIRARHGGIFGITIEASPAAASVVINPWQAAKRGDLMVLALSALSVIGLCARWKHARKGRTAAR